LVSLLKEIAKNKHHSVVKDIEIKTGFSWSSTEDNWRFFQSLVLHMSSLLQQSIFG
jgi:hypothetical protein